MDFNVLSKGLAPDLILVEAQFNAVQTSGVFDVRDKNIVGFAVPSTLASGNFTIEAAYVKDQDDAASDMQEVYREGSEVSLQYVSDKVNLLDNVTVLYGLGFARLTTDQSVSGTISVGVICKQV